MAHILDPLCTGRIPLPRWLDAIFISKIYLFQYRANPLLVHTQDPSLQCSFHHLDGWTAIFYRLR